MRPWVTLGASAILMSSCLGDIKGRLGLERKDKKKSSAPEQFVQPALEGVLSPVVAKLDIGTQNTIFRQIMDEAAKPSCNKSAAARSSAHLLSNEEFLQTLSDVFGISKDEKSIRDALLIESKILGFRNLQGFSLMSPDRLQGLLAATSVAAGKIVEQKRELQTCGQGQGSVCVKAFLENVLPRIWKKAVAASEIDGLLAAYESDGGDSIALQIMLQKVMLSPHTLFRSELGKDGKLEARELAASLASMIWGTAPDARLISKADSGAFATPAGLRAEIQAMLLDPRAYQGIHQFVTAWLETDRLEAANKGSNDNNNIQADLKKELILQATDYLMLHIQEKTDQFSSIMTAPFTVGNDNFGQYYGYNVGGATPVKSGNRQLKKFPLNAETKGLLGQPGFVSSLSVDKLTHIATRGAFVLGKMLCQNLVVPPNLNSSNLPTIDPNLSARDGLAKVTENAPCSGCHSYINGIGFALENQSGFGKIRGQDDLFKPLVLDASFVTLKAGTAQVSGSAGLADHLAQSEQARLCLVTQLFRYTHRRLESSEDACTIATVYRDAKAGNLALSDIMARFLTDPSYLNRK